MNTVKCVNCGVINWATAEKCVKCWSDPTVAAETSSDEIPDVGNATHDIKETGLEGFLHRPLILGVVGLAVLLCVGIYVLKGSSTAPVDQAKTTTLADEAMNNIYPTGKQGELSNVSIAQPPADISVTPPTLEAILSRAQTELVNDPNNGEVIQTNTSYNYQAYGGALDDCKYAHPSDCLPKPSGIAADMMKASSNICHPKIIGPVKLREAGRYNKFDDVTFFSVKVYADGLEGVFRDGQCDYKPAIAGLTTTVVLKYDAKQSGLSWQLSGKWQLDSVSYEYNKKDAEQRKKQWDDERDRKWRAAQSINTSSQQK